MDVPLAGSAESANEAQKAKARAVLLRFGMPLGLLGLLGMVCGLTFLAIFPQLALYSDTSMVKQDILPQMFFDRCHVIFSHQQLLVTDRNLGTIWDRLPTAWHRDPGGPRDQHFSATHWREIPNVGRMRSHSEYQSEKDPVRILMTNTLYVRVPGCER